MKVVQKISVVCGLLFFFSCATKSNICKDTRNYVDSYRTKIRKAAYPNGHTLEINPPSFLWPVEQDDIEETRYEVRLVKKGFTDTIVSPKLKWAVWKPNKILESGDWQWRLYRYKGNKRKVSGDYMFTVAENLPNYVPPYFTKHDILGFFKSHPNPRFFELNAKGKEIAERLPKKLQSVIIENANLFIKKEDPKKSDFSNIDYSLSDYEVTRVKTNISKKILNHLRLKVQYLTQAYLLTKNEKYAVAVMEKLSHFESLPKEMIQLNGFTKGMTLDIGLYIFDGFYNQLTPRERTYIIDLCYPIIHEEYEHARLRLEAHEFDNHVWQKGVATLIRAGLIMGGHIPEATEWIQYVASVWNARAPAGGFNFDGAWANGNSYLTANVVTLVQVPMILNKISRFDYLSHPWYQNLPKAMITTYQGQSYSNGFGDGHDSKTMPLWVRGQLAQYISRATNNPNLTWYANQIAKSERGLPPVNYDPQGKHPLDSEAHQWLINTMKEKLPKAEAPNYARGSVFPHTGVASFHTNLLDSKKNMHVAFRSSIYGSGSHTACNQNAFNIIVGGKPLFLSSGHYISFSGKHNLLHYRNTRGHNTILVNGIGQSVGKHGYGQIEASLLTDGIAYVSGDASFAYRGDLRDPMWINNFKKVGLSFNSENGFGKTPLKKFKRHLLMLDERTVIVYDELLANEPVSFDWLLHSPGLMEKTGNNKIETKSADAKAEVYLEASSPLDITLTNDFQYPAKNWPKKKINGKLIEYEKQWHMEASSPETENLYILGVIQVDGAGKKAKDFLKESAGNYKIGDWILKVNFDVSKPATLTLYNTKTKAVFHVGSKTFIVNNQSFEAPNCKGYYKNLVDNQELIATEYKHNTNN